MKKGNNPFLNWKPGPYWELTINVLQPFFVPMEFPIKYDTVKSGWSITYIKGSKVILFKNFYKLFPKQLTSNEAS